MRDVTDNVTGELDVEVKRGRGRPRKADALSNSERQAAYRARRRAERVSPMHRPVVDEEALLDVADLEDDMAELRAELDATKAELAEAHETIGELNDELIPLRAANARLEEEVIEVNKRFVELVQELTEARERAKGAPKKSVTRNEKGPSNEQWAQLLAVFVKAMTPVRKLAAVNGRAYDEAMVPFYDAMLYRDLLKDIIFPEHVVTPKRVTKKGV